jgi:hypothetical protein
MSRGSTESAAVGGPERFTDEHRRSRTRTDTTLARARPLPGAGLGARARPHAGLQLPARPSCRGHTFGFAQGGLCPRFEPTRAGPGNIAGSVRARLVRAGPCASVQVRVCPRSSASEDRPAPRPGAFETCPSPSCRYQPERLACQVPPKAPKFTRPPLGGISTAHGQAGSPASTHGLPCPSATQPPLSGRNRPRRLCRW